jgi:16S rRNA (guanine527-N7)-methyltransferase
MFHVEPGEKTSMELSPQGKQYFLDAAQSLGIVVDNHQAFEKLYMGLLEANQHTNLTAIRDEQGILVKHFMDSLTCLLTRRFDSRQSIIDVGTGAGFPGLPLAIVRPNLEVHLLDATRKKVDYLGKAIQNLGLTNTKPLWGRSEELAHQSQYRQRFDGATARAVSSLSSVLELTLPLVKVGGWVVLQKGPEVEAELEVGKRVSKMLGGQIAEVKRLELPGQSGQRYLVVVDKKSPTPKQYPRKPGVPAKNPLL